MLRLLVDGIEAHISAWAAEGEIEFANQQHLNYFGMTLEELNNWRNNDATHPQDARTIMSTVYAAPTAYIAGFSYGGALRAIPRAMLSDGMWCLSTLMKVRRRTTGSRNRRRSFGKYSTWSHKW
jgi:hypothetical protein